MLEECRDRALIIQPVYNLESALVLCLHVCKILIEIFVTYLKIKPKIPVDAECTTCPIIKNTLFIYFTLLLENYNYFPKQKHVFDITNKNEVFTAP